MDVTYYINVKSAWEATFLDIRNAKKSIYIEQYIINSLHEGEIGRELLDLLIQKSKAGIKVEILADIFGSRNLLALPVYKELKDAGIDITFTDVKYVQFIKHLPWETKRNHRKLMVVDENITHIGGVVFLEKVRNWNDFQARIVGEIHQTEKVFSFSKKDKETAVPKSEKEGMTFTLFMNDFDSKNITEEIFRNIAQAEKEILIFTPYFSASPSMVRLLKKKAQAGVSVQIYIPNVSDNIFANITHYAMSRFFRKSTVQFLTNSGPMNHAKVIRVDEWLTFGSCNFDYLSFYYNKELNVMTQDRVQIDEVMRLLLKNFIENPLPFHDSVYSVQHFLMRNLYSFLGLFTRFFS